MCRESNGAGEHGREPTVLTQREKLLSSYVSIKNGFTLASYIFKPTPRLRLKIAFLIPQDAVDKRLYSILFPRQPVSLRKVLFKTVCLLIKLMCDVNDAIHFYVSTLTIIRVTGKRKAEETFSNRK